jgi:hypothetical protein
MTHTHTIGRTALDEGSAKSQRFCHLWRVIITVFTPQRRNLRTFSGNASQNYYLLDMKQHNSASRYSITDTLSIYILHDELPC